MLVSMDTYLDTCLDTNALDTKTMVTSLGNLVPCNI
jgi:hypothetical protein